MYIQVKEDPETSIDDGATHYSPILPLGEFYGFFIYLLATAIPAGTTYTVQLSGQKEEPTSEDQWLDMDTGPFISTSAPTGVEKESVFLWARYKIVNGGGSSIDGFYGVISGKGQR